MVNGNLGIHSLTHDNITEHPDNINVLARMNIYQEVFLAVIYRTLPGLQVCNIFLGFFRYHCFEMLY